MTVDYLYFTLEDGAKAPERSSDDAAGYDLFASEDVAIRPLETVLVPTGIRMAMPPGMEAQVRPRSGPLHDTCVPMPGTIDADYRGIVGIICQNLLPLTDPVAVLMYPELAKTFPHITQWFRPRFFGRKLTALERRRSVAVDQAGYPLGAHFIRRAAHRSTRLYAPIFPS